MRSINLLAAVVTTCLFAAPAFAQSEGGSKGSTQIHCGPAKNADAAADPNCAQRVPPMPAPANSASQAPIQQGTAGSVQR